MPIKLFSFVEADSFFGCLFNCRILSGLVLIFTRYRSNMTDVGGFYNCADPSESPSCVALTGSMYASHPICL